MIFAFFCSKLNGMEYFVVGLTVLFGAALTFFSGFGLGTLMLPVFSLFFPVEVAVGATALVHLANNLFKFGMLYKFVHIPTLLLFGIPAGIFAVTGAFALLSLSELQPFHYYFIGNTLFKLTYVKVVVGILMIFFALFELIPRLRELKLDGQWIPFGGILSGFFGGLSGHQGAFRAAFLSKAGLSKQEFIGTSNAIALLIDLIRLVIYTETINYTMISSKWDILTVGVVFAFIGTYFGKKFLHKVTMSIIRTIVGISLLILGSLIGIGIL